MSDHLKLKIAMSKVADYLEDIPPQDAFNILINFIACISIAMKIDKKEYVENVSNAFDHYDKEVNK